MSRHELIGQWVEKRHKAQTRAGEKRAELALLKNRLEEIVELLSTGIGTKAEDWLAKNRMPTGEELTSLFADIRKVEADGAEAVEQLKNLGIS